MSTETTAEVHAEHGEHEGMDKKRIWRVFWILTGITAIEFLIALVIAPTLHGTAREFVNPFYIALTLLKAFFIVAYFMHLKFEKAGLIMAIILPVLFIIGLILAL